MECIKKLGRGYDKAEAWILIVSFAAMTILVFIQVIFRHILQNALSWSEEVARYMFIWISWLGVSTGIKDKEHIQVKIFPNLLLQKGFFKSELLLRYVINIIWMITTVIVAYFGWQIVMGQKMLGVVAPATQFPMWIIYLCIPVCSVIVFFRLVQSMVLDAAEWRGKKAPLEKAVMK